MDPGPLPAGVVFTYSPVITRHLDESDAYVENRALAPSNALLHDVKWRRGRGCVVFSTGRAGDGDSATEPDLSRREPIHQRRDGWRSIGGAFVGPSRRSDVSHPRRRVSHHFLAPSRDAEPDTALTDELERRLSARGDRTEVVLVHDNFVGPGPIDMYDAAWQSSLAKLDSFLATKDD